jgi:hypothetical protein
MMVDLFRNWLLKYEAYIRRKRAEAGAAARWKKKNGSHGK